MPVGRRIGRVPSSVSRRRIESRGLALIAARRTDLLERGQQPLRVFDDAGGDADAAGAAGFVRAIAHVDAARRERSARCGRAPSEPARARNSRRSASTRRRAGRSAPSAVARDCATWPTYQSQYARVPERGRQRRGRARVETVGRHHPPKRRSVSRMADHRAGAKAGEPVRFRERPADDQLRRLASARSPIRLVPPKSAYASSTKTMRVTALPRAIAQDRSSGMRCAGRIVRIREQDDARARR